MVDPDVRPLSSDFVVIDLVGIGGTEWDRAVVRRDGRDLVCLRVRNMVVEVICC